MERSVCAAYLLKSIEPSATAATTMRRRPQPAGFPAFLEADARMPVLGQGPVRMPKTSTGVLATAIEGICGPSQLTHPDSASALRALFTRPALVVPHDRPAAEEISALVDESSIRRDSTPRRITVARTVERPLNDHRTTWIAGFGELVVIEGGLMPGHSILAYANVEWFDDFGRTIERLEALRSTARPDSLGSLPSSGVFLMGVDKYDFQWKQRQRLISLAAAYGVKLRCLPEPGGHLAAARAEISKKPPHVLYVWRGRPGSTRSLEDAFRQARPNGVVVDLSENYFEDMRVEFGWELGKQVGLSAYQEWYCETGTATEIALTWAAVETWLRGLRSNAFVVMPSALGCCEGNRYLHAGRMLTHLKLLASAAEDFATAKGSIGDRFEDWIRQRHGLTVALFDGNQPGQTFELEGTMHNDLPHVKIDDAKPRNKCGRIHFAIDATRSRLILTYFGMHR